jgi:malate dehydrogenase (oxaloacetate-decarboxylating)(NADP+)
MVGNPGAHLHFIDAVIGHEKDTGVYGAMNALVLLDRQRLIVDTHINYDPTAEQLVEITQLAVAEKRALSILSRKVSLTLALEFFGSSSAASAEKMRKVYQLLREKQSRYRSARRNAR